MRRTLIAGLVVAAMACGDKAPTEPEPIPNPTIVISGNSAWVACLPFSGDCKLALSVTNAGPGCSSSTNVIARLYNASGVQVGPDIIMLRFGVGPIGGIRVDQIVPLEAVDYTTAASIQAASTFQIFPSWNAALC